MAAKLYGPFTFDGANDEATFPVPDGPCAVSIQVIGTSTQTIQLQDSYDGGTTYQVLQMTDSDTGTGVANITAAGFYHRSHYQNAFVRPRIRNTAFTSGSYAVYVQVTTYERG